MVESSIAFAIQAGEVESRSQKELVTVVELFVFVVFGVWVVGEGAVMVIVA